MGPKMRREPRANDWSAFACCRRSRGTSRGRIDAMAGKVIASAVPLTRASATSIQIRAVPVITRAAAAPWLAAITSIPTRSTRVRGSRSAMTPPRRMNTTSGPVSAASTRPSALGESVIESTANARATPAIVVPARLTVLAVQYHRKFSCRSAARLSGRRVTIRPYEPGSAQVAAYGVRQAARVRRAARRARSSGGRPSALRMLPSSTITVGMFDRLSVPRSERKSSPSPPAM